MGALTNISSTNISSISSWSNQGLIAHFSGKAVEILLIDPVVGIEDPFYCQKLKVKREEPVVLLQWNCAGTHLMAIFESGSVEIFRQRVGLVNQWESIYYKESSESKIIFSIWCENRRHFSFNPNGTQQQVGFFNSKSFNLNFVPSGRLSFLTISTDGSIGILIETESEAGNFACERISDPNFKNVSDAFAYQRSNGKILILLRGSALISVYELEFANDNFNLQLISQCPLVVASDVTATVSGAGTAASGTAAGSVSSGTTATATSGAAAAAVVPSKFIWSESKELLVEIEKISGTSLKMDTFNYQDFSLLSSKTLEIPFEFEGIFHSSRAANYIFIHSSRNTENALILNLNGEIVKQLGMEFLNYPTEPEFSKFNDYIENFKTSDILVSPNGLIVAKVAIVPFNCMETAMIFQSPIGEINSKNTAMMRDVLGKLITSSLNSYDSWDIFHLIRRTVQKSAEEPDNDNEAFAFISALLAEWISLLEGALIPARDFYSKLLDLFKMLPYEFIDAYNLVNLSVNLLSIEKILLSTVNLPTAFQEDYFVTAAEWPEIDQITIETSENLVSLLPVLEEGLNFLSEISDQFDGEDDSNTNIFALIPLDDEFFRVIGLIWTVAQAAQKQFKTKSRQSAATSQVLSNFYGRAERVLQGKTEKLGQFMSCLGSLRNDPQLQPKCTKNLFLFLTEFFLDTANLKKVYGHCKRIFSRYKKNPETAKEEQEREDDSFFDHVKCLNLPLPKPNSSLLLICRKCHRTSTTGKMAKSRRELIFSASWHNSLWKSRCPCGSSRRIVNL